VRLVVVCIMWFPAIAATVLIKFGFLRSMLWLYAIGILYVCSVLLMCYYRALINAILNRMQKDERGNGDIG